MMHTHKTYTVTEAKRAIERYCVYQERCHQEVEKKLRELRMIPEAIDQIIGHLIEHNFLNETRFAQAFARGKFRSKKWGKNRIVNELKQRHISTYNIKLALKEISDSDYYDTFEALVEKRLRQLEDENNIATKKKKLANYLFYRGWEPSLVYDAIGNLTN